MRYARRVVRWTATFVYLSLVALATVLLHLWLEWSGWLLFVVIVVVLPVVIGLGFAYRRSVSWAGLLSYLSALSLIAAVISQFLEAGGARSWFLMLWAVLLLAVSIGLYSHPMRRPGWGVFIGFWGVVGVVWLIVIQALALADVLNGAAYTGSASWPLALIGIWFVVASLNGFGAKPFGAIVDSLGILTGAALLAITISTWADVSDVRRVAGVIAAISYVVWVGGLGWVLWRLQKPVGTIRSDPAPSHSVVMAGAPEL